MKTCCTLPDVVDIDAVKKVNGPGFEVGWQRYAPCPCSRPSAPVSTAVSGGVRAQFVDLAPASNRRVHVHRNAARVRDHGDHALDHGQVGARDLGGELAALGEPRSDRVPLPGTHDRDPAEPDGVAGAQRQRPEDPGRLIGHAGPVADPDRHVATLRRDPGCEPQGHDPVRPPRVRGQRGADPEAHGADRGRHRYPVRYRTRSHHYTELSMNQRGYTIVELLVAVMIFSVGLLAMAGSASVIMASLTSTQSRTIAASVAESRFEAWTLDRLARADDVTVNVTFLSSHRQRTETFRSFLPC